MGNAKSTNIDAKTVLERMEVVRDDAPPPLRKRCLQKVWRTGGSDPPGLPFDIVQQYVAAAHVEEAFGHRSAMPVWQQLITHFWDWVTNLPETDCDDCDKRQLWNLVRGVRHRDPGDVLYPAAWAKEGPLPGWILDDEEREQRYVVDRCGRVRVRTADSAGVVSFSDPSAAPAGAAARPASPLPVLAADMDTDAETSSVASSSVTAVTNTVSDTASVVASSQGAADED